MRALVVICALLIALPALAQSDGDPEEDALFGGAEDDDKKTTKDQDEEDKLLGKDGGSPISLQKLIEMDDTLQIGGLLYMRSSMTLNKSKDPADWPLSFPAVVELYLDSRPMDRLRGFVRGRLTWNPSVNEDASVANPLFPTPDEVAVQLDELWLKFDIARAVYVTIGQQHLRFGTTRIWNPIDVINSTRREPLSLFDSRTGVPMLKLHMPVEKLGWNFYVVGLMDNVDTLEKAGVAARGEFVFSTVELGVTYAWRHDVQTLAGVDISAGIWDFDVMMELGVTTAHDQPDKQKVQLSAGVQYGLRYGDNDLMFLGVEYFYNPDGTADTAGALLAAFSDPAKAPQPFYVGRHYGAFFLSLPGPGRADDHTFTFSTIGNFSDLSFIARLDYSVRVLSYMSVELFTMVHFSDNQGELHFGPNLVPEGFKQQVPETLLDLGLNLRIAI